MPRENLISLVDDFSRFARDVAIVRRGGRRQDITYRGLRDFAVHAARSLKQRDIRTGDRVLIWGPNSAEWVASFWGCLLIGAIAVPIDDGAAPDFVARVLEDAQGKAVICGGAKPALSAAAARFQLEDLADSFAALSAEGVVPRETSREAFAALADEPITRSHIAQILFTSGTTREPRGVVLTHGNFLANLEPLEKAIEDYRKYEKWMHPLGFVSLVPLSHVFGQFMALFVPPLLGATLVFENSNHPSEVLRTIKAERATALIAVPRMLDSLRSELTLAFETNQKRLWFEKRYRLAEGKRFLRRAWVFRRFHRRLGWKFWAFISGGAALSKDTELFFKRLGYAVVQGYGMTETASLISLNHPFSATEGSVGKILPGREFRIAEDGEVLLRGENVSAGYWEGGRVRASGDEGWLHTGDLAELDREGNLRFLGRKKNVIVTAAGLNIYPSDLEDALCRSPGVRDAVVIPIEAGQNAEPMAVLLLEGAGRGSRESTKTELLKQAVDSANRLLASHQSIRHSVVWPEPDFPRTPTGKPRLALILPKAKAILRSESLPETAQGDSLADFVSSRTDGSIESLSSLDRVELLSALEKRYNVEINETAFAETKSLADVRQLIELPSARRSDYVYPFWAQRWPIKWLRLAVYYALVWPATWILAHPRILGRERIRRLPGPAIVVSNHITRRADIGLILAALPGRFRHRLAIAMGGEILQRMRRPPREWLFLKRWAYKLGYFLVTGLFNVFPLPQLSGFRESFRFAGESVDRGYSLLIFPEGVVNDSEDGKMAPFQSGIGLLSEQLRLPIVPIRLDGVWQMKREKRRLAHFGEVTINIGAPVKFPPTMSAREVAERLEQTVQAL